MNKKERRLAMATAIQSAAPAMVVVDDLSAKVTSPKTKGMADALKSWGVSEGEKAYLITKDASDNVTLSTRNMAKVVQSDIKHLNVYDVLNADKVVVEESALAYINDFFGAEGGVGVKTPRRCFDALHADGRHETSLKRGERGGVGVEGRGNGGSRPRQRATRAPARRA